MYYSVPLPISADAIFVVLGVHQLPSRIPFEGVAQRDAVRTLTLTQICRREAANLCESGEPFLHREPPLFKNRNNTTVDYKNFKSVCVHLFRHNII
jgi:hypothetical protein